MKILVFSSLYPNPAQPLNGLFVEQRLRNLLATGEAFAKVVAPVPWFPFKKDCFGKYSRFARVPDYDKREGVDIFHPRYLVIPKVGMSVAAYLMERGVRRIMRSIYQSAFDFDLIDAHYFYPDGVAAVRLASYLNCPVVITARGSDVNLITRFAEPRRQIIHAAQKSAAVITVSEALRAKLVELGVDSKKVTVLRNGVDLGLFRQSERTLTRCQLGVNGALLISVGSLDANKGHHLVIEALAELSDTYLLVIGEGSMRRHLEQLTHALGVANRVCFLGGVERTRLIQYYSAADVMVLASEREGMPNVILESLACGTPVVATPVGGVPEVVNTPEAGILATERSVPMLVAAIRSLLAMLPARTATRRYAEQFSWETTIQRQLGLFRRVCRNK